MFDDVEMRNEKLTYNYRVSQLPHPELKHKGIDCYKKGRNDVLGIVCKDVCHDCMYECERCPFAIDGISFQDYIEGLVWE